MVRKERICSGSDTDVCWAAVAFGGKALVASCFLLYILFLTMFVWVLLRD